MSFVLSKAIERRNNWINKIKNLNGDFNTCCNQIELDLISEINEQGPSALLDHVRICQYIPEEYRRDSFQEKLYAKYTDCVVSEVFRNIKIPSDVLVNRSNSPDIVSTAVDYKFITDVKSMRISRTAKNQKDFKIASLSTWKSDAEYALLISPLSHYPTKNSEIFKQAVDNSVCLLSYSHLAFILNYNNIENYNSTELLKLLLGSISSFTSYKSAKEYWKSLHDLFLINVDHSDHDNIRSIWNSEMEIMNDIIFHIEQESSYAIDDEETRIDNLSFSEAIIELKKISKINSRRKSVLSHNMKSIKM